MSTIVQIYTTVELNEIKTKAYARLDALNNRFATNSIYGIPCAASEERYKLYLYLWALGYWEQYENGDTTDLLNYISQEQLTDIVNAIKEIL